MAHPFSVLDVHGPYREPREPAFSYDYTVQRPTWPTPQAVRIKVSIEDELNYIKEKILHIEGGTPGQQLIVTRILSSHIADFKLAIANEEELFMERRDVMIEPFTEAFSHLFGRLEKAMAEKKDAVLGEIREKAKLG